MMELVVLSCLLAAASAGLLSPTLYSAPLLTPYNYRGPLSLAPGQLANILGVDSRPLDTLEVNLDRSAHYAAKGYSGLHILKERSAPLIAPVTKIAYAHSPLAVRAHIIYSAPIATPLAYPYAYGAAPIIHY